MSYVERDLVLNGIGEDTVIRRNFLRGTSEDTGSL